MKRIIVLVMLLAAMVFPSLVLAAGQIFGASCLTGGTTGCLDAINHADPNPSISTDQALSDGDFALVGVTSGSTGTYYVYVYDADASDAESSPKIIKPDSNSGNGRWFLASQYALQFTAPQGTSAQSATFLEASAGGTNYVALQAPAAITSNATVTLPGGIPTVIEKSSSGNLNADEVMGRQITNRGNSGNVELELPTGAAGMNFIGVNIETTDTLAFDPADDDKIYLDGVALDDGDKIILGSDIGVSVSCYTFTTDGTNYDWICTTLSAAGSVTDGGA